MGCTDVGGGGPLMGLNGPLREFGATDAVDADDATVTSMVLRDSYRSCSPAARASEVMRRIAAPRVGSMVTAPMPSMLALPAAYLRLRRRKL